MADERMHIWFTDGWQLHLFLDMDTGVVISPPPKPGRFQLDSPEGRPYFAALCLNQTVARMCQKKLGRAPWEFAPPPQNTSGELPTIAKVQFSNKG